MTRLTQLRSVEDCEALEGQELPASGWITVDQAMVDEFADVTGDHQWIHVDPQRAQASPFGGTIAHGHLVFALGPQLSRSLLDLDDLEMAINYGADRVRFVSPMPVGQRLRLRLKLLHVDRLGQAEARLKWLETFEREGAEKPVCVAEILTQYRFRHHGPEAKATPPG